MVKTYPLEHHHLTFLHQHNPPLVQLAGEAPAGALSPRLDSTGRRRGGGGAVATVCNRLASLWARLWPGLRALSGQHEDDTIVSQDMIVDMIVSAVRTCQCPKGGGSWVHYHRSTSPYHGQHVRFMQLVHGPYPVQLHDCMRVRGVP